MSNVTVSLADATEQQLRQIAQEQLGLSVHPNAKPDTIRAKIAAASDRTEFTVSIGQASPAPRSAPVPVAVETRPGFPQPVSEPMYTIIIDGQEVEGGDQPVPVNPGGNRNMLIPRDKECRIKHRHYHVLMNAIRTVYDQPEGPKGPMVAREVLSYPVRTIQVPPQAELDAWATYKAELQAAELAEERARIRAA